MDKHKIGIIGASGFIGTNLVRYLKLHSPHSSLITERIDLHHSEQVRYFLSQVDSIVYLAHEGGPNQVVPLELALKKNINPLKNLISEIKLARRATPIKFIYLSSGGTVYGVSKNKIPWKETDPVNPISVYGQVKIEAEKILEHAAVDGICDSICLRAANPYGNYFVHSKPQGVIDVVITRLLSGETFTLYDDEQTVRDYLHLDDLNGAILKSIEYSSSFEIFNLGSGIGTALIEIIKKIELISGKKLKMIAQAPSSEIASVPWSVLEISKAKKLLAWNPKTSLDEGLHQLIQSKIINSGGAS